MSKGIDDYDTVFGDNQSSNAGKKSVTKKLVADIISDVEEQVMIILQTEVGYDEDYLVREEFNSSVASMQCLFNNLKYNYEAVDLDMACLTDYYIIHYSVDECSCPLGVELKDDGEQIHHEISLEELDVATADKLNVIVTFGYVAALQHTLENLLDR